MQEIGIGKSLDVNTLYCESLRLFFVCEKQAINVHTVRIELIENELFTRVARKRDPAPTKERDEAFAGRIKPRWPSLCQRQLA